MIPRIDEWTPPKGTNWDEVVLPAVAKKLGMGSSPEMQVDVWGRRAGEVSQHKANEKREN